MKIKILIIVMAILLLLSVLYIGVTEFNKYKDSIYFKGVNDGIAYRNLKIVEELSKDGSTVLTIVYNNQSRDITLIPQNG